MANKRLSLKLTEDCELENEIETLLDEHENLENIDARVAKRFKSKGVEDESPLHRMLQRQIFNGSCSNLSPITELSHNMRGTVLDAGGTPKSSTLRTYNSISSSYDSGNSLDDEYMAMFEMEALDQMPLAKLPGDLDALIRGQLKTNETVPTTVEPRSVRRCLSMTAEQSALDITPIRKLHRTQKTEQQLPVNTSLSLIRKSVSMNNVDILNALSDEPQLIGDLTKPCALPVMQTGVRHRDLKTISCNTLARLMRGDFVNLSDRYKIIDCRYPYEFEGGHIRGAHNLYTRAQLKAAFPVSTDADTDADHRHIYVFHCEFSSERGPKLLRFLRNNDRSVHTHDYPTLSYPELYLLHNGYKEFFASYADLCEPSDYVPMLAPAHNEEYRLCRAKTKSWQYGEGDGSDSSIGAGDTSAPSTNSRTLSKSRSRLLYAE
ncbi:cdc25-like protein phosphatase twine [Drosophila sulfurigaster albostrigata]|uniref:cdc25-like protein phosphatase twine n=1 Tax=Drosophila sulfurigaster albostrigata TaxID=89887 RepID=UPI002D2198CA|nr:cdc25-like protein phosphatase twine [Drosophila sulfurigaster albostrigata]